MKGKVHLAKCMLEIEESPVLKVCVYMLHSIKTEPGRVHILYTATCFTSGLKMGAVFHSEIGSLTLKVCVCV